MPCNEPFSITSNSLVGHHHASSCTSWHDVLCTSPDMFRPFFYDGGDDGLEISDILDAYQRELDRLQSLLPLTLSIWKLVAARRALIAEMKDFESRASDPRRLFQSSFRLLDEEKFRKNAFPNLISL